MKLTIFSFLFLFLAAPLRAQLLINEVCSQNDEVMEDEFGDAPDWIELYNIGETTINLSGFHLTDDPDNLSKWPFPNVVVSPKSYLLVFASGKNLTQSYLHSNFKISKDGESLTLVFPNGNIADQINVPALDEDHSYGRKNDGQGEWVYFSLPTPLESNANGVDYTFADPPQFSQSEAFQVAPYSVMLSCNQPNCQIRYTTDGSTPDANSLQYTQALNFDSTVCLRARTFASNFRPSETATKTYFFQKQHQLPMMAISTDPEHLWDWEKGIFVLGPDADPNPPFFGANFWKDTEIPIFLEYFEAGHLQKTFRLGAKIHGGSGARSKPMKSLRLFGDRAFGDETIDYPFFDNKDISSFKKLVLRNASGDFNFAHMRDAYLHRYFIDEGLHLDALAYQPMAVYINGQYWGLMNLREKVDRFYLENNHDIDIDALDLLEEDTFAVTGTFDRFHEMFEFVMAHDMADSTAFAEAATLFDVENLADYFIAQTTANNTDWPGNNIKYWRAHAAGSRWRYILFDLDVGSGFAGWTEADGNSFASRIEFHSDHSFIQLMQAFWENETYRHYFINRYADLLNTTFREAHFVKEVARAEAMIDEEIKRHFQIWQWPGYETWKNERIPELHHFAANRAPFARQYVQEHFELTNQVQLSLNTFPEGAGEIQINSIIPDTLPWDGYYYNDVPVTLKAKPKPGYYFREWQSQNTDLANANQRELTANFATDDEVIALFESQPTAPQIAVFPNPFDQQIFVESLLPDSEQVSFAIYNTSGQLLGQTVQRYVPQGYQRSPLTLSDLSPGLYFLHVYTDKWSETFKLVK
ncbi:MAG: CotH kinase family protein [Bacteroidota bacterium]